MVALRRALASFMRSEAALTATRSLALSAQYEPERSSSVDPPHPATVVAALAALMPVSLPAACPVSGVGDGLVEEEGEEDKPAVVVAVAAGERTVGDPAVLALGGMQPSASMLLSSTLCLMRRSTSASVHIDGEASTHKRTMGRAG